MSVTLHLRLGDCVSVLGEYPDESVGAIVSDPPYELSFMGKGWDGTGVAYDPVLWGHLYRVLVPGGVVKAFSATRTFHRMARAMQDAGFTGLHLEAWSYGSGFPKSLGVSKAIDKAAGAEREVVGTKPVTSNFDDHDGSMMSVENSGGRNRAHVVDITAPATDAARTWDGWGTALKPSWEPVLVGRKPLS